MSALDGSDELDESDEKASNDAIRARLLRAVGPAVEKIDRVACGQAKFKDGHQQRACMMLARFARVLLGEAAVEPDLTPTHHPSLSPERAAELRAKLRAAREADEAKERQSAADPVK